MNIVVKLYRSIITGIAFTRALDQTAQGNVKNALLILNKIKKYNSELYRHNLLRGCLSFPDWMSIMIVFLIWILQRNKL